MSLAPRSDSPVPVRERFDVEFVTVAHLSAGRIAVRLGMTVEQVNRKRRNMRFRGIKVGQYTVDGWKHRNRAAELRGEYRLPPYCPDFAGPDDDGDTVQLGELVGLEQLPTDPEFPPHIRDAVEFAETVLDRVANHFLNLMDPGSRRRWRIAPPDPRDRPAVPHVNLIDEDKAARRIRLEEEERLAQLLGIREAFRFYELEDDDFIARISGASQIRGLNPFIGKGGRRAGAVD